MRDYNTTTYVGIDAHKKEHYMCILDPSHERRECIVKNTKKELQRFVRRLKKSAEGPIRMCYEAGPSGFGLKRLLESEGVSCEVIAPSLIPIKPGERIKTDRRDARNLAAYYRQDLLTPVHPPTEEEEGVREVCRCRDAAKQTQKRASHQLGKFLLRHNRIYSEGSAWTQKHFRWLRQLQFSNAHVQLTFENYLSELERCAERVKELDREIEHIAQSEAYQEAVGYLRCYRGIDTVSAMVVVSELFGFERFNDPNQLMAYLGVTPSEHSTGGKKRQGAITKTGNTRVRRILIEAAWHQRHRPYVGKSLKKRRAGQPDWVIAAADKAMRRLNKRYRHLIRNGKKENIAITAVARELAGFIWFVLTTRVKIEQEKSGRKKEENRPPPLSRSRSVDAK